MNTLDVLVLAAVLAATPACSNPEPVGPSTGTATSPANLRVSDPAPWLTDDKAAFARARADHKAVLIDFATTWATPSTELSRELDALRSTIDADFIAVRIDVSAGDEPDHEVRTRYGVWTAPAIVAIDVDGTVLSRIEQLIEIDALRAVIQGAAAKRKR